MNQNTKNLPLLRRAGRFFNRKFLAMFGIAVTIVPKPEWMRKKRIVTTQVGRFQIEVPNFNTVSWYYSLHPNYTSQQGRVAAQVKKKYPKLAAIDIGANVGDTVCIMKTAADIPILCIEGDESTFALLEKNLQQFRDVTAHKLFLGEKTETISVNFEKVGWNTTLQPDASNSGTRINIIRLDDFLKNKADVDCFKLLKIDTEGFDCRIIRGAQEYIQKVRPVITFEYNRENMDAIGEPGLDTLFMLGDLGYTKIMLHDANGRFLCTADLSNRSLIQDLHDYADGKRGAIYYYDMTVFHQDDADLATAFMEAEQVVHRNKDFIY